MKKPLIKKIAGGFFAVGFMCGAYSFVEQNFGIHFVSIDSGVVLAIFLGCGTLGFLLNLVSFKKDTAGVKRGNLLYWTGASLVLVGLLRYFLQMFQWNWIFLMVGCVCILISFYFNRRIKPKASEFIDLEE